MSGAAPHQPAADPEGLSLMRQFLAAILLCALASPAMAARHRANCVSVMIEMVPARICPPARR